MKRFASVFLVAISSVGALPAVALDTTGQRYVEQLVQGNPSTVRQAAQGLYNSQYRDPEVLDIAAEVLLQNYASANHNASADSMAWLCKALGRSGDGRYKAVLEEVVSHSKNRRMGRHCQNASRALPASDQSYRVGSRDLAHYRHHTPPAPQAAPHAPQQRPQQAQVAHPQTAQIAEPAALPTGQATFADIRTGMSMNEVTALLGAPTATFAHQTGKAWIPFNVRGKDITRVIALYQGQGRIVYSQAHMYYAPWKVIEIQPNPAESGRR